MQPTLSAVMRRVALTSHITLMLLLAVINVPVIAVILVAPLLLPLPGLLRARAYTHAWATMLLVFYVGGYLAAGYFDPAHKWRCFGIALLAAIDFVALNLFVRFLARERTNGLAGTA